MSAPRATVDTPVSPLKCARILAMDYGRRRIGLAISDELALTASPLPVLQRKNRREDFRRLRKVLAEFKVGVVLVGHPVHLSGRDSEMAAEAARFAERVEKELKVRVELRDERLTTWEAEEVVKVTGGAKHKRKGIDSMAAAILLREYLDATRPLRRNSASGGV